MLEMRIIQDRECMWELWVNHLCVTTEFVTKEAAWRYADRYLAQAGFLEGEEGSKPDQQLPRVSITPAFDR